MSDTSIRPTLTDNVADVSGNLISAKLREINPDKLTAWQALDLLYPFKNMIK